MLTAGLLHGALGNWLLRAPGRPGLGFFLWVAALVGALLLLVRLLRIPLVGSGRWLPVPVLVLATGGFLWRDSPVLMVLDLFAILLTLGLTAYYARGRDLQRSGLFDNALGLVLTGLKILAGLPLALFGDIRWEQLPRGAWSARAAAILRGLLIALPLLLLFGALFMAADAVFEQLVTNTLAINLEEVVSHVVMTGFLAWLACGYLRTALVEPGPDLPAVERPKPLSLGTIETGVVLGALNLLFLAFVLVQFTYLFGGGALVMSSSDLTYAEYARRGFFELVWVTALVLPVLLISHWLLPTEGARLFRWLAGSLVAMLAVIMASAVQRMLLYVSEFGLTELRLYPTAFMAWLALVFGWFVLTVLRGRRERFAVGALVSGLAVLVALHVLNPDSFIARVNTARLQTGHSFDATYATELSADAVPVLVKALPHMNEEQRLATLEQLSAKWTPPTAPDWRGWNWSRTRAWEAVSQVTRLTAVPPLPKVASQWR